MTDERYQHLLGLLLDDELDEAQAAELAAWLRATPSAQAEVRRTLALWEFYAQQQTPERSAAAFTAACETRIQAATDERSFVEGVQVRLRQTGATVSGTRHPATSVPVPLIARLRGYFLPLRCALAASVALLLAGWWLFPATSNQPILTFGAGARVTLDRAGQSLPASEGLELLPGDLLRVSGAGGAAIHYGKEATRVVLNDPSELKILPWSKGKRLELRQGKVEATAARQRLWSPMILVTAQAEARVLGTKFSLGVTTNATRLDVTEGRILFTRRSDDTAVKVGAGNYAVAMSNSELSALPFTGSIRREWWTGVSGETVEDIRGDSRYPSQPDGSESASVLEMQPVQTNRLGVRFCGYVHPPVTGEYEFWMAGGPKASLSMSPSENPDESVQLAINYDSSRNLDQPRFRGSSSWAPPVPLIAGRRYYVEALVLIKDGEGHLSVAWKIPGRPREPLTGEYLSPFNLK